jgi:hypothetical protein
MLNVIAAHVLRGGARPGASSTCPTLGLVGDVGEGSDHCVVSAGIAPLRVLQLQWHPRSVCGVDMRCVHEVFVRWARCCEGVRPLPLGGFPPPPGTFGVTNTCGSIAVVRHPARHKRRCGSSVLQRTLGRVRCRVWSDLCCVFAPWGQVITIIITEFELRFPQVMSSISSAFGWVNLSVFTLVRQGCKVCRSFNS